MPHPVFRRHGATVFGVYAPLDVFHLVMTRYDGYMVLLVITNLMTVANCLLIGRLSGFSLRACAVAVLGFASLLVLIHYLFRFKHSLEDMNHFVIFSTFNAAVVVLTIGLCGYLLVVLGWGRREP